MKTYITALVLAFVLATLTSMIALTVHSDHARIDPSWHTAAGHQKMALLY